MLMPGVISKDLLLNLFYRSKLFLGQPSVEICDSDKRCFFCFFFSVRSSFSEGLFSTTLRSRAIASGSDFFFFFNPVFKQLNQILVYGMMPGGFCIHFFVPINRKLDLTTAVDL